MNDDLEYCDGSTTVSQLKALVESFVTERDWHVFHRPKNLSMALAIEAAELMEHFQWLTLEESEAACDEPEQRQAIEEELADVVCYAVALANAARIDLSRAIAQKMKKNAVKYPAPRAPTAIDRIPGASAGAGGEGCRSVGDDSGKPG